MGPSIPIAVSALPSSELLSGAFHNPGEKLLGESLPSGSHPFLPLQAGWGCSGQYSGLPSSPSPPLHSPSLLPFFRLINIGIHLLQDEEREVRHEALGFASLLQQDPSKPLRGSCIFVQDNVGLTGLLQLLLAEFGEHPETFNLLVQHLPILDLRGIVEELEAKK